MSTLNIQFTKEEKDILLQKIRTYCQDELDMDLSHFDTEFLFDFISKNLGVHFYNQGLADAQSVLSMKLDLISEAISEIEKPTE